MYSENSLDGIREFCEREGQPCNALELPLIRQNLAAADDWMATQTLVWRTQTPDETSATVWALLKQMAWHLANLRAAMDNS